MKNQFTKIGTLFLLLLTVFACDKKETRPIEIEDQQYAVVTHLQDIEGTLQKAIIVGTKTELEAALMKDGPAQLKRASETVNILIPTGVVGPVAPNDPYEACWDEITASYEAHIEEWQGLANETCEVVWRCLTCPEAGIGLFAEFYIQPNPRLCATPVEATLEERFTLNPFNFGDDEYESEAVLEFIREAK